MPTACSRLVFNSCDWYISKPAAQMGCSLGGLLLYSSPVVVRLLMVDINADFVRFEMALLTPSPSWIAFHSILTSSTPPPASTSSQKVLASSPLLTTQFQENQAAKSPSTHTRLRVASQRHRLIKTSSI